MSQAEATEALVEAVNRQNLLLERADRREEEALEDRRLERSLRPRFRNLRPLTSERMLMAVPGVLAEFGKEIPGEYWSQDGDAAVISCPCGAEPAVTIGHTLKCPGGEKEPDCNRWFLYAGREVRVARQTEAEEPDS